MTLPDTPLRIRGQRNRDIMEFLLFDSLRDAEYRSQVYELLKKCDKEFVPPLSQRNSTSQKALNHTAPAQEEAPNSYFFELCNQPVIIVADQGQVLGFMSFIVDYTCADVENDIPSIYVTTVIVDPDHRGTGLTRKMYGELMELAAARGKSISTRTWSTNLAHITILSQLGFYELLRIDNGRGPGIDTVYYRKDVFREKEKKTRD